MKNEIKVGILGLLALTLLIWGYNFLKGKNIFSGAMLIKAEFKTVVGLNIAAPVLVNGFKVGAVTNIYQSPSFDGTIIAELSLEEKVSLPKNTIASIITPSLMSGNVIALEFSETCQGANCLQHQDKIQGRMGGLTMVQDALNALDPYLRRVDTLAGTFQDMAANPAMEWQASLNDVQASLRNLKTLTELLNSLVSTGQRDIQLTLNHVQSIAGNLKSNNDEISNILKNLETLSADLAKADLAGTNQEVKNLLGQINNTMGDVQGTVKQTEQVMQQVAQATDFAKQQGLVGALLHDAKLKQDVASTIKDLDLLLLDLRLHPERYRTVLSGKKKPYVSPEEAEAKKAAKKKKKKE